LKSKTILTAEVHGHAEINTGRWRALPVNPEFGAMEADKRQNIFFLILILRLYQIASS
jgi:hypothetical protein